MLCTALPLTPRALPQCTNPQHYHGVHCHTATTGLVSAALPARQAGWPGTPDFAEWARGKIQISRNEGGTQNTDFAEWGRGTQNPESIKPQQGPSWIVKSTLFNFLNNYDTVLLSSVISVTVKTTDEHLVGRRSPGGVLLWFFGKRSVAQKTTRGHQKDTYYWRQRRDRHVCR